MKIAAFDDYTEGIEIMLHNKERQVTLIENVAGYVAIDEHGERKTGPVFNAATVNALLQWLEHGGTLP